MSVKDAAAGHCPHILHSDTAFSPRGKASTQIRIVVSVRFRTYTCRCSPDRVCCSFQWPGYEKQLQRQVQTKDETPAKNPITLRKFIQHVGRSVEIFFRVSSPRLFAGIGLST